jgi:hypothetical protein
MTSTEAQAYGRKVKRAARNAVEMGDAGTIVLNADWQVADKSRTLGIVGVDGYIDTTGEIARAFQLGFQRRALTMRGALELTREQRRAEKYESAITRRLHGARGAESACRAA